MILVAVILFLMVLAWDVLTDYAKWKNHNPVKHKKEALIRMGLLLPSLLFFIWAKGFSVGLVITSIGMVGAVWWELFDGFYNKLRGFSWRFNGAANPEDDRSRLDLFLQGYSGWQQAIIKWYLIFIFTLKYISL